MSIYNLLEYSFNYSDMTGSLLFYSKPETTNFNADATNTDNFNKCFTYKVKLLEKIIANLIQIR